VRVGALIAHDPHRSKGHKDGKKLPETFGTGFRDFADHDVISFAEHVQALPRYFTDNSNRKARARKRLTPEQALRHSQCFTKNPDFVFEKIPQGLYNLEREVFRDTSHVVMRFNTGSAALPPAA